MKRAILTTLSMAALSMTLVNCDQAAGGSNAKVETFSDSASYAIGINMARSLDDIKDDINPELVKQALNDRLSGKELQIDEEQLPTILRKFGTEQQTKMKKKQEELAQKNIEEGQKFLEENKAKEGVTVTESGLQYVVEKQGDGAKPVATDKVKVHYKGTLLDGTEFDSSFKRKQPATFNLDRVIKGWTEGIQLMPVGSKFKFFVPSELAYGPRGAGKDIAPNATLIFEVELLEIIKEAATAAKKVKSTTFLNTCKMVTTKNGDHFLLSLFVLTTFRNDDKIITNKVGT